MGKLSDALERQQSEKEVKNKMLQPEPSINDPESSIPNDIDPKLAVCTAPGSIDAENFKVLKSQILFSKEGTKPKTIMVTSALPNEGKTFTASNLAVSLAHFYIPKIDRAVRYRSETDTYAKYSFHKNLSFKAGYLRNYNTDALEGTEKTDDKLYGQLSFEI